MLVFFTIAVMLIVAYSFFKEGIFTAFTMMINVLVAGLVAFNLFEPLAGLLDSSLKRTFLEGYEDALSLAFLFAGSLALLRLATNNLVESQLDYYLPLQQIGAIFFGLVTGYLLAGFQLCLMQTLPWHENFMDFEARVDPNTDSQKMRSLIPPDRVWLAMMHYASQKGLGRADGRPGVKPFDDDGSFEIKYARYRRYGDTREQIPYSRELPP